MVTVTRQVFGFWRGFSALFAAAGQLLRMPSAWPYALVPPLVFVLIEAAIIGAAWHLLEPWWQQKLSRSELSGDIWSTGLALIGLLTSAVVGWIVAASLAPVLSAPALERIVVLTEHELGAPPRQPLGFFAELACGARSFLVGLVVTVPLIVLLSLLELVAPPLAIATTPLKLLLGALGVAWGLFDYPLTLRGVGARQRFAFVRHHFSVVLGFGAAFSLLFWLPCFGTLLLPVGVVAATRLYWAIERAQ